MMTSASSSTFEKSLHDLNLISRNQGRCMAAISYHVRRRITVSAQHSCEDVFGKKVGLFPSHYQDGDVDSVPIFPQVHAVLPRISERVSNVRVAQRFVALPLRLPFHAMNRQMTPMLVFQFSQRRQHA